MTDTTRPLDVAALIDLPTPPYEAEPVEPDGLDDADAYDDPESDHDPNWGQPYRDDRVHVMREKCTTCVFRPGNLMHLNPGRLQDMAAQVQESGVPFSCHQTLSYSAPKYKEHYDGMALCRGAVDAYGDESVVIRMAYAMDVVEEVEPYPGPAEDAGAESDQQGRRTPTPSRGD